MKLDATRLRVCEACESLLAARAGQLNRARSMAAEAVAEAQQAGQKERAATFEAGVAVWEALFGIKAAAKRDRSAHPSVPAGCNRHGSTNGPVATDFIHIEDVRPAAKTPGPGRGASRGTFLSDCGRNEKGHHNSDNYFVVPGVSNARVEIVFDPPWDSCKMSDAAKLQLGML